MGEVNINISGRNYGISCQDGQEDRVNELGSYVDARLKDIAKAGAASNENHLLVLTTLMLADEIHDLRQNGAGASQSAAPVETSSEDEAEVVNAIGHLAERIDIIAKKIQSA